MVVWLCHARVGHRQGLYPETPSPATVGVFLLCAGYRTAPPATAHRQRLYPERPPCRGGLAFCAVTVVAASLWARPIPAFWSRTGRTHRAGSPMPSLVRSPRRERPTLVALLRHFCTEP